MKRSTLIRSFVVAAVALAGGQPAAGQQEPAGASDPTATAPPQTPALAPSVTVGPNVQVSLDGEFAHVEFIADAHPTDPNKLVCGAVTTGGPIYSGNRVTLRTYATADGGQTWRTSYFDNSLGPDPALVYGPDGSVFFTGIRLNLMRSRNGGFPGSWEDVGRPTRGDHPMMAIDRTSGAHRGRIYLSVGGYYVQTIDTEGEVRFHERKQFAETSTLSFNPLVLDDGSVFFPFVHYVPAGERRYDGITRFTWSLDGGETFEPFGEIHRHRYHGYRRKTQLEASFLPSTINPHFAVDRTRDRIYMVWQETPLLHADWLEAPDQERHWRVYITHTDDRGKTWTPPTFVDPEAHNRSAQWLPAVAVNHEGVVGVLWLDTRDDPSLMTFHAYFAASFDGQTFSTPRRLSNAPSHPMGPGNKTFNLHLQTKGPDGAAAIGFDSGYRRWHMGGDYIWITAAADGAFHPFWPDARTGTFQAYTARVHAGAAAAPPPMPSLEERDITELIEVHGDGTRFDPEQEIVTAALRLRNKSKQVFYPPLKVELVGGQAFRPLSVDGAAVAVGDSIDYSDALGDLGTLPPGAVTDAKSWRFVNEAIQQVPRVYVKVRAQVPVD